MTKKSTAPESAPVTFHDKAFKSRTVVLPDGRTFAVEKSRITTADPALIDHLDQLSDFERAPAEAATEA